uniref:Uncharacterized protein n=1 Tax=Neovison vison TaxID=452646 RepID=A0A8C7EJQ4_NEOVI
LQTPFLCPFLSFPLRGPVLPRAGPLLLRPASLVPHGAGHRAPAAFVLCAHPRPKRSQEASPPSAQAESRHRPADASTASWRRANVIPNCHVHTMCSANFLVYESQVL